MSESKLPLLKDTIPFPNRPARNVDLRFYEDGIELDIVHNASGRVIGAFHIKYSDGNKTAETLTEEVVERVKSNISQAVTRYDNFRGRELKQLFSKLNPINQIRDEIRTLYEKIGGISLDFVTFSSR